MLRICKYNQEVELFLLECYEKSIQSGLHIEKRLENPTPKQIQLFQDSFHQPEYEYSILLERLNQWIPSVMDNLLIKIADSFMENFKVLRGLGKNDNVLKNVYIKFMCWLRFTFGNMLTAVSDNTTVLYIGETITLYELIFLSIIEKCGCHVVITLTSEDSEQLYRNCDPDNQLSREFLCQKQTLTFKQDFSFAYLQKLSEDIHQREKADAVLATNIWMLMPEIEQIVTPYQQRGSKHECLYNAFFAVKGVKNIHNYQAELFQFKKNIEQTGRCVQVVQDMILPPDTVETASVKRKNAYDTINEMLCHLAEENFSYSNSSLTERVRMAFKSILLDESENETRMNRMQNLAIYQICCLKRYEPLFADWDDGKDLSLLIGFSSFMNKKEQVLLKILSRLPLDIICFYPDKTKYPDTSYKYCLEIEEPCSVTDAVFPNDISDIQFSTVAYGAEQELNDLLYDGSCGIYRPMQYQKLKTVRMRTTLEEIEIFWKEEPKYRPGFQTAEDNVILPVLFAKVNGVKEGLLPERMTRVDRSKYGKWIRELLKQERTLLVKESIYPMEDRWVWEQNGPQRKFDVLPREMKNTWELLQVKLHLFWKDEHLERKRLMTHSIFRYQYLRKDMQEMILDKIEQLIQNRWIEPQNEPEYVLEILSVLLNIPENILQLLHGFDFTGPNPKLLFWIPDEQKMTRADSILVAFLHLCGFDILFLVPTGYQTVESYYTKKIWEEYQAGKYRMNLQMDGKISVIDYFFGNS